MHHNDIYAALEDQLYSVSLGWYTCLVLTVLGLYLLLKQLTVPRELSHLPVVPIMPLLWSYAIGEPENERIERLILPFANSKGEGLVVVYALGRWMIHVLDWKVRTLDFILVAVLSSLLRW